MNEFSLAHLTVLSLPPPEMVSVAARTGYQAVGLRLIAVTPDSPGYPLMDDVAVMRETKARLDDTGLRVGDIEFVKITPEIDIAGRYNLSVLLEFFPWTVVPNVRAAKKIVDAAGRKNTGILVDTLHFARSESRLEDIAAIAPDRLPMVHVCDAKVGRSFTTEQLLHTARAERLPPGEGDINIREILGQLPSDVPIGLEVPMESLTHERGPEEVARRVLNAAVQLLAAT